jgi:multiple sugar transport system substrate-binding protein
MDATGRGEPGTRVGATALDQKPTRRRVMGLVGGIAGSSLLAACGGIGSQPSAGGSGSKLKGKISLSVWGAVYEDDLYTVHYIPEFQKQHPEVQVEFIRPAGNYRQYLETAAAGGTAPDVMRQAAADAGHYVRNGMNRPLDDDVKRERFNRDDFYPYHWPLVTWEGKTYGIPQDTNLQGAYVNRRLFQEAGLKLPDENYSFEQLVQDARRLTKVNAAGTQQYALVAGYGIGLFYPLVYAQGGKVWKDDTKSEILLTSDLFLRAAEFYKRNLVDPGYMPRPETLGERGGAVRMFYNGEAAILFDGTHRAPFTLKEAPDLDWVAVPYLSFGGKKKTTAGFPYWAVWSQSKLPDVASRMLFHMQSGEGPIKYWQLLWVAPPANRSAVKNPAFKTVPGMPGQIPSLKDEKAWQEKCAWTVWCLDRSERPGGVIETESISKWNPIVGTETSQRVTKIFATTDPVQAKPALEEAARAINGYIKQHG